MTKGVGRTRKNRGFAIFREFRRIGQSGIRGGVGRSSVLTAAGIIQSKRVDGKSSVTKVGWFMIETSFSNFCKGTRVGQFEIRTGFTGCKASDGFGRFGTTTSGWRLIMTVGIRIVVVVRMA